eukprot:g5383.t1
MSDRFSSVILSILDRADEDREVGAHERACNQVRRLLERVLPAVANESGLAQSLVWLGNGERQGECALTRLPAHTIVRITQFCGRPGAGDALACVAPALALPQPCLGGRSVASHATPEPRRVWDRSAKVALRSCHGTYLTAAADGALRAQAKHVYRWSSFTVRWLLAEDDDADFDGGAAAAAASTASTTTTAATTTTTTGSSAPPSPPRSRASSSAAAAAPAATPFRTVDALDGPARARADSAFSAERVALQSCHGGWLTAHAGGRVGCEPLGVEVEGVEVEGRQPPGNEPGGGGGARRPGAAQVFELHWHAGGAASLRCASTGAYLSAQPDPGAPVECDRAWVREWERFTWQEGGAVAIYSSAAGKWLSAAADTSVACSDTHGPATDQRLLMHRVGEGLFAFCSAAHGKHLGAKPSSEVECGSASVAAWERLLAVPPTV